VAPRGRVDEHLVFYSFKKIKLLYVFPELRTNLA